METILVLGHTEADGSLARPVLEAIAAARNLGGELHIGLIGAQVQPAADSIAGAGAIRILAVSGEHFAEPRYATDAVAAEAICRASGATLVIAPATSRWSRALPGVAFRLGGRIDTHAIAFEMRNSVPAVTRWFYRQRMEAVLTRSQRPWIVLLDAGCVPAWAGEPGHAAVEMIEATAQTRTTVTGTRSSEAGEQTIRPDAKLLFVAGAGWTKKQADGATHTAEAERLILDFLRASQASLGSSKSLVDLSCEGEAVLRFMTHMNQIGQTGATPRHAKGLSTCCHGEEPHAVGWRFIGQRRAVNLDANCGWARGKTDVLYVADAFEVMRQVNALLASS